MHRQTLRTTKWWIRLADVNVLVVWTRLVSELIYCSLTVFLKPLIAWFLRYAGTTDWTLDKVLIEQQRL